MKVVPMVAFEPRHKFIFHVILVADPALLIMGEVLGTVFLFRYTVHKLGFQCHPPLVLVLSQILQVLHVEPQTYQYNQPNKRIILPDSSQPCQALVKLEVKLHLGAILNNNLVKGIWTIATQRECHRYHG